MKKSILIKYTFVLLATLFVVGLYHMVDIRLFNLDITQATREHFFKLASSSRYIDESIIILNSGKLEANELNEKIDSLLACQPAVIGVNPCHITGDVDALKNSYVNNKKVIFANCSGSDGSLSRILDEGNTVTHFRHNNDNYFEFKVDYAANPPFHQRKIAERKNDIELINFINARKAFYRYNLNEIGFIPEFFGGKTILIGYLGDYVSDSTYYLDECRVTPMNEFYGYAGIAPDLYDTEISAIIINQLDRTEFINEINDLSRILILLLVCVLNVLTLTLVKTRWLALNVIIAFILFILLVLTVGWVIVYSFVNGYYINLDEMPLLLFITAAFTVGLTIFEQRKLKQSTAS